MHTTAKQLKDKGLRVHVTHKRRVDKKTGAILPRGGQTEVTIIDPRTNLRAQATAKCSKRDNFSRRLGSSIALGRAYKQLQSTPERTEEVSPCRN